MTWYITEDSCIETVGIADVLLPAEQIACLLDKKYRSVLLHLLGTKGAVVAPLGEKQDDGTFEFKGTPTVCKGNRSVESLGFYTISG